MSGFSLNATPSFTGTGCKNKEFFDITRYAHAVPNFKKDILKMCNGMGSSFRWIEDNSTTEYEMDDYWMRIYQKEETYRVRVEVCKEEHLENLKAGQPIWVKILAGQYSSDGRFSPGAKGYIIFAAGSGSNPAVVGKIIDKNDDAPFNHTLQIAPTSATLKMASRRRFELNIFPIEYSTYDDCYEGTTEGNYGEIIYEGSIGRLKTALCITEEELYKNPEVLYSLPKGHYDKDGKWVCKKNAKEDCMFSDKVWKRMQKFYHLIGMMDWFGTKNTNPGVIGDGMGYEGLIPQILQYGTRQQLSQNGLTKVDLMRMIELSRSKWHCDEIKILGGYGIWDAAENLAKELLAQVTVVHNDIGPVREGTQPGSDTITYNTYKHFNYRGIKLTIKEIPEWHQPDKHFGSEYNLRNTAIMFPNCPITECDGVSSRFIVKTLKACNGHDGGMKQTETYGGALATALGKPSSDNCTGATIGWSIFRGLEVICPWQFTLLYQPSC